MQPDFIVHFCLSSVGVLFLVFYALLQGNEVTLVARFILIIFFLLTAYFIILPSRMVKLLFALTLLQCIFLIGLEFILLLFFNLETYEPLRHYFIDQGWGDVYTFTGHFYNIPVKGNALLPFVYMLSYFIPDIPSKTQSLSLDVSIYWQSCLLEILLI